MNVMIFKYRRLAYLIMYYEIIISTMYAMIPTKTGLQTSQFTYIILQFVQFLSYYCDLTSHLLSNFIGFVFALAFVRTVGYGKEMNL